MVDDCTDDTDYGQINTGAGFGGYTEGFYRSANGRKHDKLFQEGIFQAISKHFLKEGKRKYQGKEKFGRTKQKKEGKLISHQVLCQPVG